MAYSPISFHTPFLIDDQLEILGNLEGNHLLDFRLSLDYTDSLLQSVCSYIYEGIPITKISSDYSDSLVTLYDNKVMAKSIVDSEGNLKTHPWNKAGFQSIYSDLVIENSSVTPIPSSKKLEVFWMVINANYVNIDSLGNIISLSPLLIHQTAYWRNFNSNKVITNTDYFGVPDIIGYGYKTTASGSEGGVSLTLSGTCTVNMTTKKVVFSGGVPSGVTKVAIYPNSSAIDNPVIGLKNNFEFLDNYVVDESAGAIKPPTAISTNTKSTSGPLTGQTKPNWYVNASFPDDVFRSTKANTAGGWSIPYPRTYTTLELEQITAAESEVYVDSETEYSNEQQQSSYGVPLLKLSSSTIPNTLYTSTYKNLIQKSATDYTFSQAALGGYHKFSANTYVNNKTVVANKFILSGLYVGRSPTASNANLAKKFLSYPGSIVQETGLEVLYSYREVATSYTTQPALADLYTDTLLAVSAGPAVYNLASQIYVISYGNDVILEFKDRYKIRYEVSYDAKSYFYTFKWDKNVELESLTQKWSLSWDSEIASLRKDEYYIRYEIVLPEDREVRDFYFMSWQKDLVQTYSPLYKISYEAEQSISKKQEWEFKWETTLIDRAVIKPYYVKKFEDGQYINCISFQVYVDYNYIENYLVNNQVYFYFSNPPKYELVQFDYNMLPYAGVFLEEILDEALNDKEDVPDRYILLGNYTIRDVALENSFSLDIMADLTQVNEYRSYWVPEDLQNYENSFITLSDNKSKALALDYKFRDDHHTDTVELDLVILTEEECCFTQQSVGSRCSPY